MPQVVNPNFEFVSFTTQGPIDINKLTQADLREPQQQVRDSVSLMDDAEIDKLIESVISKIFCAG